jgi:hypothetical protein
VAAAQPTTHSGVLAVGALGVLLLVFVALPPWLVLDGVIADPAELYGAPEQQALVQRMHGGW